MADQPETSVYNEWAAGLSIANPPSNEYFEEIPTELNNPANFSVDPSQIPENRNPLEQPSSPPTPPQPIAEPQDEAPEVLEVEGGGEVTLEKTNKGWHAQLDCKDSSIAVQNFYGANLKKLVLSFAKAQVNASKAIRKLKKEKLLGGDEPARVAANTPQQPAVPKVSVLTADEEYEIKNKLNENLPSQAFDVWAKKRFGLDVDQLAAALKSAGNAERIVEAQKIKSEVEDVNQDFVSQNPDWAEEYSGSPQNLRRLVGRMSKHYLGKKITDKTPQTTVDDVIYELYSGGFWTVENLETAKEELIDSGLLDKVESPRQVSQPQPQPVAPPSPSVPTARIAPTTGQTAVFGTPVRNSTPTSTEERTLSDVDLQTMPLDQLRLLAQAQLRAQR